jgi:hypothetical protein
LEVEEPPSPAMVRWAMHDVIEHVLVVDSNRGKVNL